MRRQATYDRTITACYIGYITQAIANNFAPLLYLTFSRAFSLPLAQVALLSSINFGIQILVDFLSAKYVDRIGYRACVVAGHISNVIGLCGFAMFPFLVKNPFVGLLIPTFFNAVGGGITEVLISPIVEACPTERKEAAMSLLHSFYCWGVVGVILLSTAFFAVFGVENWRVLSCLWAIVPFVNIFNFLVVPINHLVEDGKGMTMGELFRSALFWLMVLLMICSGASELALAQWASAFTESALGVSKTVGDLLGPCLFAVLMGVSRVFYAKCSEKVNLRVFMLMSGALCVVCYLMASLSASSVVALIGCGMCGLSVGILWPGTFSIAAKTCPRGGTAMFALLAFAGDIGGAVGPGTVGIFMRLFGGNLKLGVLSGIIFPVLMIAGLILLKKRPENR